MPGTTAPIFTARDAYGNKVIMTHKTWNHIVTRHPAMSTRLRAIQQTVENPMEERKHHQARMQIYESCPTDGNPEGIRVLVDYADMLDYRIGGTSGKVTTAYPPDSAFSSRVGPRKALR